MRPDEARARVANGALVIGSQAGDLQGNTNTARNLALQDVNGDWTAESKLVFSRPLANNNEQGGIIAYADDNNYVKLAWEMSSVTQPINKLRVVVIREQNGTATTLQVTGADAQRIVGADGAIWLRLAKRGSTYKAYYSSDGRVLPVHGHDDAERRSPRGPAWSRSTAAGPRPTSTSPSTTSGSRARVSRCRACRRRVEGTVGGSRAGDAVARARRSGVLRRVHAGRRAHLRGEHDRDRDLERG